MKPRFVFLLVLFVLIGCGGLSDAIKKLFTPTDAQLQAGASSTNQAAQEVGYTLAPLFDLTQAVSAGQASARQSSGHGTIQVQKSGTITTVVEDYGTGVTDHSITRSGAITMSWDSATGAGTVLFTNFAVNGTAVTGSIALTNVAVTATSANMNLISTDLSVNGDAYTLHLSFASTSGDEKLNGNITTVQNGKTITGTLTNLDINPGVNGNYTPDGGDLNVTYPYGTTVGSQDATLDIFFLSTTPSDKIAHVSVNGGSLVNVTLN